MLCSTALAIGMHLGSWHSKYNNEFNTANPGMYLQYNSFVVGSYKNSVSKQSNYVGYVFDITEDCRYEVQIGAVSGYTTKVLPYVAASVKFDLREVEQGLQAKVTVIPLYTIREKIEGIVLGLILQKSF